MRCVTVIILYVYVAESRIDVIGVVKDSGPLNDITSKMGRQVRRSDYDNKLKQSNTV